MSLANKGSSSVRNDTSVIDNTNASSSSSVAGHVIRDHAVSVHAGGTTIPPTQGSTINHIPVQSVSQTDNSPPSIMPKPMIIDTLLSFVMAFRLKGDIDFIKKSVTERFCNDDVEKS